MPYKIFVKTKRLPFSKHTKSTKSEESGLTQKKKIKRKLTVMMMVMTHTNKKNDKTLILKILTKMVEHREKKKK